VLLRHGTQTKISGTTLWKEMFLILSFEESQGSCCSDTGWMLLKIEPVNSDHFNEQTWHC